MITMHWTRRNFSKQESNPFKHGHCDMISVLVDGLMWFEMKDNDSYFALDLTLDLWDVFPNPVTSEVSMPGFHAIARPSTFEKSCVWCWLNPGMWKDCFLAGEESICKVRLLVIKKIDQTLLEENNSKDHGLGWLGDIFWDIFSPWVE